MAGERGAIRSRGEGGLALVGEAEGAEEGGGLGVEQEGHAGRGHPDAWGGAWDAVLVRIV